MIDIDISNSLLGKDLRHSEDIEGSIKENRGMEFFIMVERPCSTVPEILKASFVLRNAGDGEFAIYLHKYVGSRAFYAEEIIEEIKSDYNIDISIVFNTACLKYARHNRLSEESEKSDVLLNHFFNRKIQPRNSVLVFIGLLVLRVESFKLCEFLLRNEIEDYEPQFSALDLKKWTIDELLEEIEITRLGSIKECFFKDLFSSQPHFYPSYYFREFVEEIEPYLSTGIGFDVERKIRLIKDYLQRAFLYEMKKNRNFTTPLLMNYVFSKFLNSDLIVNSIYDPAMGIGNTLVESVKTLNNTENIIVRGNELNQDTYYFGVLNLLLNDLPIEEIVRQDSLNSELSLSDLIVSVPPFGLKLTDNPHFKDGTEAFVDHIEKSLSVRGKALFIVPNRFLSSTKKNSIIRKLINDNVIDAVIQLPRLHTDTGVLTSLIILDKEKINKKVFLANLSDFNLIGGKSGPEYVNFLHLINLTANSYRKKELVALESEHYKYVKIDEVIENDYNLKPDYYIFKGVDEFNSFLKKDNLVNIGEVAKVKQGYTKSKKPGKDAIPAKVITVQELRKNSDYKMTSVTDEKTYLISKDKIIEGNLILVPNSDLSKAKILNLDNEYSYSINRGVFSIELDEKLILPEYFIQQMKSKYTQLQFEKQVTHLNQYKYVSGKKLSEIKIELPLIEEQVKILSKVELDSMIEESKPMAEFELVNAIKHYIANNQLPARTSLKQLNSYSNRMIENTPHSIDDKVGPNSEKTVKESFFQVESFINDVTNLSKNIYKLYKLDEELTFDQKNLKTVLTNLSNRYKRTTSVEIIGDNVILPINNLCLSIIIENLFSNFHKHGIEGVDKPKVEFEIIKEEEVVSIIYKNNGKPFAEKFDFEDFVAYKASGNNAGSGLGGKLIAKAVERCGGSIEPLELHGNTSTGWNVVIKLILNRNSL